MGAGGGHPHKVKELQVVFTICGLIVLILFVALVIAILFVIDNKARHIADKQQNLINAINGSGKRSLFLNPRGRRSMLETRGTNITNTTTTSFTSQRYCVAQVGPLVLEVLTILAVLWWLMTILAIT